jgi:hypothetical protein
MTGDCEARDDGTDGDLARVEKTFASDIKNARIFSNVT